MPLQASVVPAGALVELSQAQVVSEIRDEMLGGKVRTCVLHVVHASIL